MKSKVSVALIGNYFNAHQLPIAEAFVKLIQEDVIFIATEENPHSLTGRDVLNKDYGFVYQNTGQSDFLPSVKRIIDQADIVVAGSYFDKASLFKDRLSLGKTTFFSAERILKRGKIFRFFPLKAARTYANFGRYADCSCLNYLCLSAFLPLDFQLSGIPTKRMWKWGYFPEVACLGESQQSRGSGLAGRERNEVKTILWLSRLIGWKRPQIAIEIAKMLQDDGIDYKMIIAGDGDQAYELREMIAAYGLANRVKLVGNLAPKEVKSTMEQADIYLFTPDRNEGWGTTLNEAMACGCAVVASSIAGSTPWLVEHGVNGLVFDWDSVESCYRCVKRLMLDDAYLERIGRAARATIRRTWQPYEAVKRLVSLQEALSAGQASPFDFGPCSRAAVLEDEWYKEAIGD